MNIESMLVCMCKVYLMSVHKGLHDHMSCFSLKIYFFVVTRVYDIIFFLHFPLLIHKILTNF